MAAILKFYRRDDPADEQDVQKLVGRFQYLMSVQRLWAVEWQEIYDYVLPRKNSILVQRYPGSKRTSKLFDSTALDARRKFVSGMHGGLTSSYLRWFFVETELPELNQDQASAIWLDQVGWLLLSDFNASNFAQEVDEAYNDLVAGASACTFMEEKPPEMPGLFAGFRFRTEQIGRYAWSEGADGMVNTLFRELVMSREAIASEWKDVPEEKLKGDNPDEPMSVIHCVVPMPQRKIWRSVYLLTDGKYKLSDRKFDDFQFLCPRWSKASGETYGRGLSHDAMPDIRTLNKMVEMGLRALPKIIDPPLSAVNSDVIGPARLVPGGVTNLRSSRENIGPLLPPGTFDLRQAGLTQEEMRRSIRNIYHENELQFQEGPQMTATEAMARREQMQMLLGPTLGRLEKELLSPLISKAFKARARARALPPLPPAMRNALAQRKIRLIVRYDGPIARAQRASDVDSMTRWMTFATPIIQQDPAAADVIDSDEMLRISGRKLGVPPQIVRDKGQTDTVRQVKAAQNAQAQRMASLAQAATAAGAAAPLMRAAGKAPEPGSPLAQMGQPQAGSAAA